MSETTRVMKSYEELQFRDDFMFGKVMEDPELCKEVLECLLQKPIGKLKEVQTQREFRYTVDGKPIEWHQLPKRSRYYQGAIDIDYMDKGKSYKKLPESSVMFICTFDPFKKGLSKYSFQECCWEMPGLMLGDGTQKIFYNCKYQGNDLPEELRKLYDYVEKGKADSDLTRKIEQAVDKGRKNALWRTQYMKEWVVIQDAREEGIELGEDRHLIELICKKLRRGKDVEQIADEVEEDISRVQAICNVAEEYAPDYNVEDVLRALHTDMMV